MLHTHIEMLHTHIEKVAHTYRKSCTHISKCCTHISKCCTHILKKLHTHIEILHTHIEMLHTHIQILHTHIEMLHTHIQILHTHIEISHTHIQIMEYCNVLHAIDKGETVHVSFSRKMTQLSFHTCRRKVWSVDLCCCTTQYFHAMVMLSNVVFYLVHRLVNAMTLTFDLRCQIC